MYVGCTPIINYKKENFEDKLKNYDAVFDTLGGEALEKSFKILRIHGKIVSVSGMLNVKYAKKANLGIAKTILFSLISRNISSLEKKYNVEYSFLFMKASGKQLEYNKNLIEKEKIKPVIDKVFNFEENQKSIEYVEARGSKGKVIIKIK